jgi:hypothetical protein
VTAGGGPGTGRRNGPAALAGLLVAVLGLAATVVGLWPGLVAAQLTGGGQAALFFGGLGLLVWGGTWLGTAADRR